MPFWGRKTVHLLQKFGLENTNEAHVLFFFFLNTTSYKLCRFWGCLSDKQPLVGSAVSVLVEFSNPQASGMPEVRIPEREERRPPRQCNSQKGKFIADSNQGSCRIQRSGAASESPEPKLLHKFIG